MSSNATDTPKLYVTIEGLRAQIIANATMVFTVPATLRDKDPKERSGYAFGRNNKDLIFDIMIASQKEPESFQAMLMCGDLMLRSPIAVGLASETVGEALYSLLRLTMAELATKKMRPMLEREIRTEGEIDKKFL